MTGATLKINGRKYKVVTDLEGHPSGLPARLVRAGGIWATTRVIVKKSRRWRFWTATNKLKSRRSGATR